MAGLVDPMAVAGRTAPSRVIFGPHETNLGRGRRLSDRHAAYYRARAAGGAGMVITETASVLRSDWPYERAPLAESCGPGWAAVAAACQPHGTLVLAGLGHCGGQGSSAFSQSVLWAPSPVADVVSREMPAELEPREIAEVVDGFARAARRALDVGLDGVEVDAGYTSLLRQFHSGLTNQRTDEYADRLRLTGEVLQAVRGALGVGPVLSLRLCCDELAPWAGVTPDMAAQQVDVLSELVDLIVVVRGGPFSSSAYRPDAHTPPTFNLDLCRQMRAAAQGRALVALQGSVVEPAAADAALAGGVCDAVEMTRAQIAEPNLVSLVRAGTPARVRPCILCNQACRVRDDRNPVVSCVGEPRSGYETIEPDPDGTDEVSRQVLVVGAGPSGLECARVLAGRGHTVRVLERADLPGGAFRTAATGPGRKRLAALTDWLLAECLHLGVTVETGREAHVADIDGATSRGEEVVLATGGRAATAVDAGPAPDDRSPARVDALSLLGRGPDGLVDGPIVVDDPVGGPVGVGVAEWLAGAGREVSLVTPDQVAGAQLSRTGDLADANTRLQRAGVRRELRSRLRETATGRAVIEDVWTAERRSVPCAAVVDCGHRLPEESLYLARPGTRRAGDCVAPRTVLEAVLEGRRQALAIAAVAGPGTVAATVDVAS
ncbi:MAG TPA: mycofactocin system FadH/OYE family oxidoreductase 1 [Acidimicrobiales bacterium]|nr:mycofactocin system FadH/OYE family oxidoreductase 1 [Acidimicrobiales bacterium]